MNIIFNGRLSFLLSMATIAVLGSGLSAQAETIDTGSTDANAKLSVAASSTPAPVPGTAVTSADPLTRSESLTPQLAPAAETTAPTVAQFEDIDPGQATRGGSSYIGVAANFGLDGETALGDTNFTVISKIGFLDIISLRPSVVIDGEGTTILVPVTYDFSIQPLDAFEELLPIAPYLGAGVAIATGENDDVGFLLSGGVDYTITPQFTATAAVNVGFLDETEIGLLVGVGYNFSGLLGGL